MRFLVSSRQIRCSLDGASFTECADTKMGKLMSNLSCTDDVQFYVRTFIVFTDHIVSPLS